MAMSRQKFIYFVITFFRSFHGLWWALSHTNTHSHISKFIKWPRNLFHTKIAMPTSYGMANKPERQSKKIRSEEEENEAEYWYINKNFRLYANNSRNTEPSSERVENYTKWKWVGLLKKYKATARKLSMKMYCLPIIPENFIQSVNIDASKYRDTSFFTIPTIFDAQPFFPISSSLFQSHPHPPLFVIPFSSF